MRTTDEIYIYKKKQFEGVGLLPFTVLASVARLAGSTLVASISKAFTGRGEPT